MPGSSVEADGELGASVSAGAAMLGPSLQEAVGPLLGTQSSLSSLAEEDHLLRLLRPFFLPGDAASTDAADFSDALEPLRAALSPAAAAVAAAVLSALFAGALVWQEGTAWSELGV